VEAVDLQGLADDVAVDADVGGHIHVLEHLAVQVLEERVPDLDLVALELQRVVAPAERAVL
jgi:hypothetical protein